MTSSTTKPMAPATMAMNSGARNHVDELGPAKVVHLAEARTGLRAVLVIDNLAAGPAIGGVRMALDAGTDTCVRLARAMTLKNAMSGLRHGGAKACITADARCAPEEKEALVRAFASRIATETAYIPGPDMGTDERAMAWIDDETGRAVGLPAERGGLPLDELGATARGLVVAAEVAASRVGLDLAGARVAVQGYGSVGRHVADLLAARGCVIVAASDSRGGTADEDGLDVGELAGLKRDGRSVAEASGRSVPSDLIDIDCDLWIPAAGPDVVRLDNVDRLRTRVVVQGANIAVAEAAEARLHECGVVSVPDFVANAGGVICGAVEYAGGSEAQAFARIEDTIRATTEEVLAGADRSAVPPRQVALDIARGRVLQAMSTRRWN